MAKISLQLTFLGGSGLPLSQIFISKVLRCFKSRGETMMCMWGCFPAKKLSLRGKLALENAKFDNENLLLGHFT